MGDLSVKGAAEQGISAPVFSPLVTVDPIIPPVYPSNVLRWAIHGYFLSENWAKGNGGLTLKLIKNCKVNIV